MTDYKSITVAGIEIPMGSDLDFEEYEALWIKAGEKLLDSGVLDDPYYVPSNCEMSAVITADISGLRASVDRFVAELDAWLSEAQGECEHGERNSNSTEGSDEAIGVGAGPAPGEDR